MTSPAYPASAVGSTPNYGLKFLAQGAPAKYTRAILEDVARSVDAALTAGGIAPPGAADAVALAGRIAALENPPRAVLRQTQTGVQTGLAAGSWQDVQLQAEDVDSHNGHSTVTNVNRWTCPAGAGGTYHVEGNVLFAAVAAGATLNARLVVSRSGAAAGTLPNGPGAAGNYGGAAGSSAVTGSKLITLAPGDWVGLQGYCSAAWATAWFSDACSSLTLWRVAL